jgi:hypothetical protein
MPRESGAESHACSVGHFAALSKEASLPETIFERSKEKNIS